jgi:hypothetical protein
MKHLDVTAFIKHCRLHEISKTLNVGFAFQRHQMVSALLFNGNYGGLHETL